MSDRACIFCGDPDDCCPCRHVQECCGEIEAHCCCVQPCPLCGLLIVPMVDEQPCAGRLCSEAITPEASEQVLAPDEARRRWLQHAAAIDRALAAHRGAAVRAAVVVSAGRVVLRVYRGPDLVAEAPLTRRQALLLASDLLDALLIPKVAAGEDDPAVLVKARAQDIANTTGHGE